MPLSALLSGGATGRFSAASRLHHYASPAAAPRSLSQSPGGVGVRGATTTVRSGAVDLARDNAVAGPSSAGAARSSSPAVAASSGSGERGTPAGSGGGATAAADEGELFLFDMSEIGRDGRRSVEEQRQLSQRQRQARGAGSGAGGSGPGSRYGAAGGASGGIHRGGGGGRW